MTPVVEGLPVSVQVRLARHARAIGADPNLVMARFAIERFLYRLSRSPYAERFVLKGALLMLVWLGEMIRPTRDGDLLGFGDLSPRSLATLLAEVCVVAVEPDGLEFLPASIRVVPIRPEAAYGGLRATLQARLGKARLRVQLDVGIGDAVTPEPEWLEYPGVRRPPFALTPEFADLPGKQVQWAGFLRKNGLASAPGELLSVVTRIARFLEPVIAAARRSSSLGGSWEPGGPWKATK